jgi:hypothetical protein
MSHNRPDKPWTNAETPSDRPACSTTMHDNVEVWEDCCVCEPEPRWQALGEELESAACPPEERCIDDE